MVPLPRDATSAICANGDAFRALASDFPDEWVHRNQEDVRHVAEFRAKLHADAGRVTDLGAIDDKVDADAEHGAARCGAATSTLASSVPTARRSTTPPASARSPPSWRRTAPRNVPTILREVI